MSGWDRETVVSLFSRQVLAGRDRTAVRCGGTDLSYGELDDQASRLAAYLRASGVGPETLVGICLERSADLVVALLAILKSGGAYLPLDPEFPAARLALMVAHSGTQFLVTTSALRAVIPTVTHTSASTTMPPRSRATPLLEEAEGARPGDLAYVLYTSGSTGVPKGIAIEHGSLTNFLLSMQREPGLTPPTTCCCR